MPSPAKKKIKLKVSLSGITGKTIKLCSAVPPLGHRCADKHVCCLVEGHTTPHRTKCGIKWNKRGG